MFVDEWTQITHSRIFGHSILNTFTQNVGSLCIDVINRAVLCRKIVKKVVHTGMLHYPCNQTAMALISLSMGNTHACVVFEVRSKKDHCVICDREPVWPTEVGCLRVRVHREDVTQVFCAILQTAAGVRHAHCTQRLSSENKGSK